MGTKKRNTGSFFPASGAVTEAQRKASKALRICCKERIADADETLDPVEASDAKKAARRTDSEPDTCLGFACPEKSDMCDSCTVVMKELVRDLGREGIEPAVPSPRHEPRKWFYSVPDLISGGRHEVKQYVRSGTPAFRGVVLSKIMDCTP